MIHLKPRGCNPWACLSAVAIILATGCAYSRNELAGRPHEIQPRESSPEGDVVVSDGGQVISSETRPEPKPEGWDRFTSENLRKSWKKAVGRGPNQRVARAAYEQGQSHFQAKRYDEAAEQFYKAVDRWPDSGLEEDAMFWLAESYFFGDRYSKANDAYGELIKKYTNSRHLDTIVPRQFAIARYWDAYYAKHRQWPITPNPTDKTRPWFDTGGHAVAAYDNVRLNDPRSPLADDAVMAQGNFFFLKGYFSDADYYYGLLRSEYPKSEHQLKAHQLGLQCKLRKYQGPSYDGTPLVEAEELIDQMMLQFPGEIEGERERLARSKGEVRAQRALREWTLAQYYDNGEYYAAASRYYQTILNDYPQTAFADQSRKRLDEIKDKPGVPEDQFEVVTRLFDEEKRKEWIASLNKNDETKKQ